MTEIDYDRLELDRQIVGGPPGELETAVVSKTKISEISNFCRRRMAYLPLLFITAVALIARLMTSGDHYPSAGKSIFDRMRIPVESAETQLAR